jgi:phenylalanyl-tRNA synthetase alpha chain
MSCLSRTAVGFACRCARLTIHHSEYYDPVSPVFDPAATILCDNPDNPMMTNSLTPLAEALHPLERRVLALFAKKSPITEAELRSGDSALQEAQLSMALGWLQTKQIVRVVEEIPQTFVSLTEMGLLYAKEKIPALRIADEIRRRGALSMQEIRQNTEMESDEKSPAIGALRESGAVSVAAGGVLVLTDPPRLSEFEQIQRIIEQVGLETLPMVEIEASDWALIATHHRKRGKSRGIFRVDERVARTYGTTERFDPLYRLLSEMSAVEEIGLLTPELLKSEAWRGRPFRQYNIQLPPPRLLGGRKHPYKSFLDHVKQKFVAMGFAEMRGPLVESEFWNMDALYMPQFHPAREIHDVYFVKGGGRDETIPEKVIERVAAAHQDGGASGSRGWRYPFDTQRTRRLILRSQGTAVSARTLGAGPQIPGKYFSIARCFRYDAVDATHAPDFFQVEGIVLGHDIHFRTLLGLLTLFAKEIAQADELKFLPAYFPFTEPSVELHIRHPRLGWMELGGAGIFRPEVTGPLGVDVPVIAWGLGLDRMAMVALNIADIRDLFSPDLNLIRSCGSYGEQRASLSNP